jgi:RHS repeat-associated protein
LAGGGNTALGTNRDGQVTTQTMPGQSPISRVYTSVHDDAVISTGAAYANTVNRYVSFDSLGRIARQMKGVGDSGHAFAYDGLGHLVGDTAIAWVDTTGQGSGGNPCADPNAIIDPYGNACTYGEPIPSGYWAILGVAAFSYDGAGNRLDQSGSYGTGNRIRGFAGCTYVTDSTGDGNVLSRTCGSEVVRFWWTAESRLAALKVGADSLDFRYDASGRLVRKDLNGARQAYFLWQGDNLLAELDSTATGKVAEYSYYPGLDNPHAVITGTTPYFAHTDAMGNVIALTDSATQSVKRSYTFEAWGQLWSGSDSKPFTNADRARFKGALWLGPQLDVYFMRARWYEPMTGRFLSEDPLGLEGGINPYAYAGADPVNGRDPSGLDGFDPCPSGYELHTTTRQFGDGTEETTEDCVRNQAHTHDVAWGDQTAAALWAGAMGALASISQSGLECWIRTDSPHMSTHEAGNISVSGTTWCLGGVPLHMSVITSLQVKQCPRMSVVPCSWRPWVTVATKGYGRYGARTVTADAGAPCTPGYYRGYSLHSITFSAQPGAVNGGTTDNPHEGLMYFGC